MNSVTIQKARSEDSHEIADVYVESFNYFLPFVTSPYTEQQVRDWIVNVLVQNGNVMVAVEANKIVGMSATSQDDKYSWLDQLYLLPSHCHKGIGSLLLIEALERLPKPMRLYTFQKNEIAKKFYEKHKFIAIKFGDGSENEESEPDILYELR